MIVDALLIDGADFKPRNSFFFFKELRCIADYVLDEDRIIERLHGYVALVRSLEQRIDWRRRGLFGDGNEFLDPYQFPESVLALWSDGERDSATLIVRPVITDFLGTRTEGRHGNFNTKQKIVGLAVGFTDEGAAIIHRRGGTTDRCFASQEIRKINLNVGGLGFEAFLQFMKYGRQRAHGHFALMVAQHFQKPTHVRALKMVGQADRHGNVCRRLLALIFTVQNRYGKRKVTHADLVNRYTATIFCLLNVGERLGGGVIHDDFQSVVASEYSAQELLVSQTRTLAMRTEGRSGYFAAGFDT